MKHGKHVISTRAHQTREHDKHVKHTKHESPQARHLADSTESQSYKTFIKRKGVLKKYVTNFQENIHTEV